MVHGPATSSTLHFRVDSIGHQTFVLLNMQGYLKSRRVRRGDEVRVCLSILVPRPISLPLAQYVLQASFYWFPDLCRPAIHRQLVHSIVRSKYRRLTIRHGCLKLYEAEPNPHPKATTSLLPRLPSTSHFCHSTILRLSNCPSCCARTYSTSRPWKALPRILALLIPTCHTIRDGSCSSLTWNNCTFRKSGSSQTSWTS